MRDKFDYILSPALIVIIACYWQCNRW